MNRKYERLGTRYGKLLWVSILLIATALIAIWILTLMHSRSLSYETVALYGDPVVVWSWERTRNRIIRIEIPADTYVSAIEGYGTYSLASLWKLGEIEGREGEIFAKSLEEALGIPVRWYIGPSVPSDNNIVPVAEAYITLGHLWEFVTGKLITNIPITRFFSLAWRVTFGITRSGPVFDLSGSARTTAQLPDGTPIRTFDMDRWDTIIGNAFEDGRVRKEALPVAVFNTTSIPALGDRIARILGHLGVLIVTVGNDEGIPERCIVSGTKENLAKETPSMIAHVLGCDIRVSYGGERADIVVRLGGGLAQQYMRSRR